MLIRTKSELPWARKKPRVIHITCRQGVDCRIIPPRLIQLCRCKRHKLWRVILIFIHIIVSLVYLFPRMCCIPSSPTLYVLFLNQSLVAMKKHVKKNNIDEKRTKKKVKYHGCPTGCQQHKKGNKHVRDKERYWGYRDWWITVISLTLCLERNKSSVGKLGSAHK